MKIPLSFYQRDDVLKISKELLGKALFSNIEGTLVGGMIVETEAYQGPEDRASHAYNNRLTSRTAVMFEDGGVAYVYLCYGIHHLLNVVTSKKGIPHAVLIRAVEPFTGVESMLKRRSKKKLDFSLTRGPGSTAEAFGITLKHNGFSLKGKELWLEDYKTFPSSQVATSPRIGVGYAKEDAFLPWRFFLKDNPWVS